MDFFNESLTRYVLIPSTATLDRDLVLSLGGFPEGMRLGEDQYLWTKLARVSKVCFTPDRLARYSKAASNRSASIYVPEQTRFSFEDLYDPSITDPGDTSNEYVARAALGKALVTGAKCGSAESRRAARFFAYTQRNRCALRKLRALNALPSRLRAPLLKLYNRLAWLVAKRGL